MSICGMCAKRGTDCCRIRATDNLDYKFGLTVADVRRVAAASGCAPSSFARVEAAVPHVVEEARTAFPGYERMYAHNMRVGLRFDAEGGRCTFHSARGCTLSLDQRPRFCALSPIWYIVHDNEIDLHPLAIVPSTACLLATAVRNRQRDVFKVLGVSDTEMVRIALLSHKELDEHVQTSVEEIMRLLAAPTASASMADSAPEGGAVESSILTPTVPLRLKRL